eukprot:Pgem_evm2s1057
MQASLIMRKTGYQIGKTELKTGYRGKTGKTGPFSFFTTKMATSTISQKFGKSKDFKKRTFFEVLGKSQNALILMK